jgi:hypothetical protein
MISKPRYKNLFLFTVLLLSLSCADDPAPAPASFCRLTKWTLGDLSYEVEYNSSGFASKVTGSYAVKNQQFVVDLEYENGRLLKINNGPNSFDELIYDTDRLKEIRTMQKTGSADFTLEKTATFEYNSVGQVTKAKFSGPDLPTDGSLYQRAVYEEANTDQVFTTSDGSANGVGPEWLTSDVLRFDNANSFQITFPFSVNFLTDQDNLVGVSVSYNFFQIWNNPLEGKKYSADGSFFEYAVVYEYNDLGYPTKITREGHTAELVYDCIQ